jgi:hypothetical protein
MARRVVARRDEVRRGGTRHERHGGEVRSGQANVKTEHLRKRHLLRVRQLRVHGKGPQRGQHRCQRQRTVRHPARPARRAGAARQRLRAQVATPPPPSSDALLLCPASRLSSAARGRAATRCPPVASAPSSSTRSSFLGRPPLPWQPCTPRGPRLPGSRFPLLPALCAGRPSCLAQFHVLRHRRRQRRRRAGRAAALFSLGAAARSRLRAARGAGAAGAAGARSSSAARAQEQGGRQVCSLRRLISGNWPLPDGLRLSSLQLRPRAAGAPAPAAQLGALVGASSQEASGGEGPACGRKATRLPQALSRKTNKDASAREAGQRTRTARQPPRAACALAGRNCSRPAQQDETLDAFT